jgi:sialate O-acetylesterase
MTPPRHRAPRFALATLPLLLLLPLPLMAAVTLPAIISDHMVLQRAAKVRVWGTAAPQEQVTVRFGGQAASTRAGADGSWRVALDLSDARSDASALTVRGEDNEIVVADVLVGEVWLASGQSNMQKPLGEQKGQQPTFNAEAEIAAADHPDIRLFKVARRNAASPAGDVGGSWVRCSPASVEASKFSAAAYYFGRQLQATLHRPVGLIDSTVGGTRIELWTPPEQLAASPPAPDSGPMAHALLFNGMIAGLAPFGIKGVIWYQGESNILDTDDGAAYTPKMAALVAGWRQRWQAPFPFYYVQVAPHSYSVSRPLRVQHGAESVPLLWEAQAQALRIPDTAMVVTTDLVDNLRDIHPRDKKTVGVRLARLALVKSYGIGGIEPVGPSYRAMALRGDKAVLSFDHAEGLMARDGKALTWFEVAGADGVYRQAEVAIDGATLIVGSPEVATPVAVRFAWHEAAQPNLVNGAGLPALPFRSEHPIPAQ